MIRAHVRSNIVGYVALFVALSGTAVALPATNTVFSDDIVNGEVRSRDISDTNGVRSADVRDDDRRGGGLAAIDLAPGSVGRSEIATDGVGSPEILPDGVRGPELATDSVCSPEIAPCKLVEKPRRRDADADVRFLDQAELDALLAVVPGDDIGRVERVMYLAAAMSGLRQGEPLALRWMDVDWSAQRIRVRRNFVRGEYGTPKSKRSTRS